MPTAAEFSAYRCGEESECSEMTEKTWAPAPWQQRATWVLAADGGSIARMDYGTYVAIDAAPYWKNREPYAAQYYSDATLKANARLIAQAPALYEALEELLADFIGHHPDNGDRFCKMCHAICDPDDRIPFEHREFFPCYRSSAVLATARGEA